MKWVSNDPPTTATWKSLISKVVALEKIGHCGWKDSSSSAVIEETVGMSGS